MKRSVVMIVYLLMLVPREAYPEKVLDMADIKFAERIYTAYFCTGNVEWYRDIRSITWRTAFFIHHRVICHLNRGFKFNLKTEIPKLTELWREATKEVKSSTSTNKDEVIENFNQCVLENIKADFRDFVCLDKSNYIYARHLDMMMFLEVDWYCAQSDNTTWLCKIVKTL
ncbi:hypothetical protein ACHWQZ_G015489 [Mnemiopsis leidyi]